MDAYHELAKSYDRLTNDVDYEATVAFYYEILKRTSENNEGEFKNKITN